MGIDRIPVIDRNTSYEATHPRERRVSLGSHAQKVSAIAMAAVMIASGMSLLLLVEGPTSAWTQHDQISVVGDAELAALEIWDSGDGSESSPYRASGGEIYGFTGEGIRIQGTTLHFVISDTHINSTTAGMLNYAVYFDNVSNATIEGSLINTTMAGIYMTDCDNVTVTDVDFISCLGWAVDARSSEAVSVSDSYIMGQNGVLGQEVSAIDVVRCEMEYVEMGVSLNSADNSTVLDSSFLECGTPVSLQTADRCNVSGNVMGGGSFGIKMNYAYNCVVSGNAITQIDYTGIWSLWDSFNNTISSNLVANCSYGGILMELYTTDCVLYNNTLVNNTDDWYGRAGGVALVDCTEVTVYHNTFMDNAPANAYDSSEADNRWNESYPTGGNYWDDYSGVDEMSGAGQDEVGADGFGDTQFDLDADTNDSYPLMAAPGSDTPPVASFTFTPDTADAGVEFSFDASGSSDAEDPVEDLQVRWDWDGDGNWDTGYSTVKTATHTYSAPDTYTVRMEVMDTGGMTDIATDTVVVTGTAIPEFGSLIVPVLALMALFLVLRRHRRT